MIERRLLKVDELPKGCAYGVTTWGAPSQPDHLKKVTLHLLDAKTVEPMCTRASNLDFEVVFVPEDLKDDGRHYRFCRECDHKIGIR